MSIFEALMLICFGLSWPMNIWKSWTTRSAVGKSLPFLLIIEVGYICGMLNKILVHFDWVFFLYVLNFLMVGTDAVLYFRNRRLDRLRAEQEV
ncbi:hypothetical protein [Oscillibacter ruminantium]|jgi:hypothetical protein|uniref:hypothetical protein n=1 Tax=Oscillibacter ruminantium TaxID=1263547 RepID=UPI0002EC57E7|nr:hypothetical protein [Oscillibacter ruminantium]MDN0032072.1 hypothetical protein [Oscillibacter valericigenes]MEA5041236.1 hypothetical protein [Oscillibacter ruminantium]